MSHINQWLPTYPSSEKSRPVQVLPRCLWFLRNSVILDLILSSMIRGASHFGNKFRKKVGFFSSPPPIRTKFDPFSIYCVFLLGGISAHRLFQRLSFLVESWFPVAWHYPVQCDRIHDSHIMTYMILILWHVILLLLAQSSAPKSIFTGTKVYGMG